MKTYYRIGCGLILLLPFISLSQNFDPKTVVPKSLSKYNFGMGLEDFTKKNKSAAVLDSSNTFRIEYLDKDAGNDIRDVTYYFDAEIINLCMK